MLSPTRTRLAAGVLLAFVLCLWPGVWRLAAPALSPFLALCAPLAVRSLGAASLLALPMLAAVLLRRRFWCRHLCPVGLLSESCGRLRGTRAAALRKSAAHRIAWPPARLFAAATFVGALAGYPLFLWLDPLALYAGFFSIGRIAQPGVPAIAVIGLPLVLAVSFVYAGTWCSRLCPLGGTQDLLAMLARRIRPSRPRRHLVPLHPQPYARRTLLAAGAGLLSLAAVARLRASRSRELRPPGAVEEAAFEGACIRCGSCTRVCPTGIIQPVAEPTDPTGFLAPRLRFSGTNYCRQDCNLCGQVCPTGVIRPLSLPEKNRQVIGIVEIDLDNCYLAQERECGICIPRCPRAALVDIFDYKTYRASLKVIEENCNGCGACVGICPPKVIRIAPAKLAAGRARVRAHRAGGARPEVQL